MSEPVRAPTPMRRLNLVVGLVAITMLLLGGVAFARTARTATIDPISWTWGLPGLGLAIVLALIMRWAGSSTGGRQPKSPWVVSALTFGLLMPPCTWAFAAWANRALDGGSGQTYETEVLARPQEKNTGRSGTSEAYYLEVAPFLPAQAESFTFRVGKPQYRVCKVGRALNVTVRDGWLGYRWLDTSSLPTD